MYRNTLTVYGEYLARNQALPTAASEQGNGGSRRAGGMLGAAEVVMVAAAPVTLAEGTTLTLSLQESMDDVSFTDMPVSFRRTLVGAGLACDTGDVLARLPLSSDAGRYVRAVVATDDATAAGSVDILFEYQPR